MPTTPTSTPVPSQSPTDLLFNTERLDEVVNSTAPVYTDRFGVQRKTVAGIEATTGYMVPVSFTSGISVTTPLKTVKYNGDVYHADPASVPFTTTGTFNAAQWFLVSNITREELAATTTGKGVAMIGAKVTGASTDRTQQEKVDETPSVLDYGAVGNGSTIDTTASDDAIAAAGVAFFPPMHSYRVDLGNGLETVSGWSWHSDESFAGQGTIHVTRKTSGSKDAIYAGHYGTGTGYALHGISYATSGSGVGGATWGIGAGVVGNKRGATAGNGVYGSAGIDNGANQTGVYGQYTGTAGGGTGVAGVNESTATTGSAGFFWRKNGAGQAVEALRDGSADGLAISAVRSGSGAGDAIKGECSTTAGGAAVTGVRKVGATIYAIGYLGYYDPATSESAGLYAAAFAGTTQWAIKADGAIRATGLVIAGGGVQPLADNGANCGASGKRWSVVYAVSGTINTSDRNAKQDIRALDDAELRVASRLKPLIKAYRWRDASSEKGEAARIHIGWMAQDVAEAFCAEGLDPSRYGMWCVDRMDDGTLRQGLRMDQVMAFILAAS